MGSNISEDVIKHLGPPVLKAESHLQPLVPSQGYLPHLLQTGLETRLIRGTLGNVVGGRFQSWRSSEMRRKRSRALGAVVGGTLLDSNVDF